MLVGAFDCKKGDDRTTPVLVQLILGQLVVKEGSSAKVTRAYMQHGDFSFQAFCSAVLSLDLRHSRPTFPNATTPQVDATTASAEEGEE